MSSTGRGKPRRELDFYPTPGWCVRALLKAWQPPFTGNWLEPCSGDGAIIKAVTEYYGEGRLPQWTAVDIKPRHAEKLPLFLPPDVDYHKADFLKWESPRKYSVVITNPPYLLAQEFVEKSLTLGNRVAMLLRLGFIGSEKRFAFHRATKPDIYVLPQRVSYTGDGQSDSDYSAWFVYGGAGGRFELLDLEN